MILFFTIFGSTIGNFSLTSSYCKHFANVKNDAALRFYSMRKVAHFCLLTVIIHLMDRWLGGNRSDCTRLNLTRRDYCSRLLRTLA